MSFRRQKRQMRAENRFSKIDVLADRLSQVWAEAEKERMKLSQDPVMFFEQVVGFKPTSYQRDLAEKFVENQFVAMRWNRQSGKSWIASALLLNCGILKALKK